MGKVHASLFSGFGAGDLAATWMGWDNAFWCEIDDFCRTVLSYHFPKSTGYGNIKETDFTPWRGKIDILTGGFPCQPFSCAGQRKGAEDDRYLWPEMLRAIREIRPAWVIGENVAGILSMVQPGDETEVERQASLFEEANKETLLEQQFVVDTVCRDLEREGYSVQPVVIPACAVEAPHRRDRVWFIAYRADAGVENVRSKRENEIHQHGITSDTHSSGRIQFGERRNICHEEQHDPDQELKRSEQPVGAGRRGKTRTSSYSDGERCDNRCNHRTERPVCDNEEWDTQKNQPERAERKCGTCENGTDAPYTYNINGNLSGFCTSGISQFDTSGVFKNRRDWRYFPSQPPVCRGNDGLPFDVERLTISLRDWREGAIKGYGNAIVPQVIYEIFKAIETVSETS